MRCVYKFTAFAINIIRFVHIKASVQPLIFFFFFLKNAEITQFTTVLCAANKIDQLVDL